MPDRYLRTGLLSSERIAAAGEPAEILFTRLLLVIDDFARYDGRLTVICRACWPGGFDTDPKPDEVRQRLDSLIAHKAVVAYEVGGKPFIYIPNFKQRTRAKKSKWPAPPQGCPADDGQMPDNSQSSDGQVSGGWRTPDGHPQAVSGSVSGSVSYSRSLGAQARNEPQHPRTASAAVAKTQQQLAEQREHAANASAPPGGSVADFARKALKTQVPPQPTPQRFADEP